MSNGQRIALPEPMDVDDEEISQTHQQKLRLTLPEPMDIDDEEIFQSHRQKLIEDKLLKCYAEEIAIVISKLVNKNCNGCFIQHPSQRQHDCLMMEADEKLWIYFDDALENISQANVMKNFIELLKDITPNVNGLELLKYTCNDWKTLFCVDKRKLLKRETYKLL